MQSLAELHPGKQQQASSTATITSRCKAVISMCKPRMTSSGCTWILLAWVLYEVVFGLGTIGASLVTTWLMLIGSVCHLAGQYGMKAALP